MTKVTAFRKNNHLFLQCTEHSDDEIICAGISAICYALCGYVINFSEDPVYDIKSGFCQVCCAYDEKTHEAFRMALIGLMQIEKSHPEAINIVAKNILP